jgi:hypothetical protein
LGDLPSSGVDAVDSVGVGGGLDVGSDLLANCGVDGIVDKVDVEGGGIGACQVSRNANWNELDIEYILNGAPLHNERA